MKILISPAKSLDFENNVETSISSKPIFADQAHKINNTICLLYTSPSPRD